MIVLDEVCTERDMNLFTKFDANPLYSWSRPFTPNHKCKSHDGSRGKVRGFILWGP